MKREELRKDGWGVISLAILVGLGFGELRAQAAESWNIDSRARDEIEARQAEKASRSPTERKIASQLLQLLKKRDAPPALRRSPRIRPEVRDEGRVKVDLRAVVSPGLLAQIEQGGGSVVNSFARYSAIRANLPIELLPILASRSEVKWIRPAAEAMTQSGSVRTQGDITHRAGEARNAFGVDGGSFKIGVLSDSVDYLDISQDAGELPAVRVLPGQAGIGYGEGTAMLEIVHDLAPGAELHFATAFGGPASFAQNIRDLYAAGCRIFVDDVIYFEESPFQAGVIGQAVAEVAGAGALYFWSAGNGGNKSDNTSGTWEGPFFDGGPTSLGRGGRIHSFGGSLYNSVIPGGSAPRVDLYWNDPLGASGNDYDIYVLDSTGSVVSASDDTQDGDDDPIEFIGSLRIGDRIVIVKHSGADRYLHLGTGRSRLEFSTGGSIRGHGSVPAESFFSVAATWVRSPAVPFVGGAVNAVETFSSDGPRRIFFFPDGSAVTPGNFSANGGAILPAPAFTAADGTATSVPGFESFFGTSAAAPHAAAVAALLWSYNPSLTPAQIRTTLASSALDIEAPGIDVDSGAGIVMATAALEAAPIPSPRLVIDDVFLIDANHNGGLDPDECADLGVRLRNSINRRGETATGVLGRLISRTPGLVVDPAPREFVDMPAGEAGTNLQLFRISTTPSLMCSVPLALEIVLTTSNAGSFTLPFQLTSRSAGSGAAVLFESADIPAPLPDLNSLDSSIDVSNFSLPIANVRVSVHITHSYDSDLTLALISPDGTLVELSSNNGGSSANYGADCSERTVFSDAATTGIDQAQAPFAGIYRPEGRLADFNGKHGSRANGSWILRLSDRAELDTGMLRCWSLELTPVACFDGGGGCLVPPRIVTAPSSQTATNGSVARFSVAAEGSPPLAYQWFFNGTNRLANATNTELVLARVDFANVGGYSVFVSNRYGTILSSEALLTVVLPPEIREQPRDVTITNGENAAFAVVALGSLPLTYEWRFNGELLPSARQSTLFLSNAAPSAAGLYAVTVRNPYGAVTSREATLTVVSGPIILQQPQDQTVSVNGTALFSVSAGGSLPFFYQWFHNETNALVGATNAVLILANTRTNQSGAYSVQVRNVYGTVVSVEAVLTVSVANTAPLIAIRTPADGASFNLDDGPIAIHAVATEAGRVVRRVELMADGALLARKESDSLEFAWLDPLPGTHRLWAIAEDDRGARGTSSVVSISVELNFAATTTLISTGEVWNYLDTGVDQGALWRAISFDDSNWGTGPAELGYGDADSGNAEATVISFGPSADNRYPTYYFRRSFILSDTASFTNLEVRLLRDDGGVVYLNGVEVFRSNMPTGTIQFFTFASGEANTADETNFFRSSIDLSPLTNGANVLAVEIHQANGASSDVSFDAELVGRRSFVPRLVHSPESQQATVGDSTIFSIEATGPGPFSFQWYFNGTELIANATNGTLILSPVSAGNAGSYHVVVSNRFGITPSLPASLVVRLPNVPPIVSIIMPTNNALLSPAAGPIPINAAPEDSDGTVSRVEFYLDDVILGSSAAPFTMNWLDSVPGGHTLVAVAIDNDGARATSSVHAVTIAAATLVTSSLIPTGSVWRYLDTGVDLGHEWRPIDFDDATWLAGPAELGYGDASGGQLESTLLRYGPEAEDKFTTYYFRHAFVLSDPGSFSTLHLRLLRDDGAAVYLNGVEIFRDNLPAGELQFGTFAQSNITAQAETFFLEANLESALLIKGLNVLAVEVHQVDKASDDVSFDLGLDGQRTFPPKITHQPQSRVVTNGSSAFFSVAAIGSGSLRYQWLRDGQAMDEADQSDLILSPVTPADAGLYTVSIVNAFGSVTSAPARLEIIAGPANQPPAVSLAQPFDGRTFEYGASVRLLAAASDSDGEVIQMEFFADGRRIGATFTSPFEFLWPGVTVGEHSLSAVATDNLGLTATSAVARITVALSSRPPVVLVATGAVWRFLDTGVDQVEAWRRLEFDDSRWRVGPGELGYGDGGDGRREATQLRFGPDLNDKFITYYFRRSFAVTNAAEFARLQCRLVRDDGAVVYLNDVEVFRSNMPEGPIGFATLSAGVASAAEEFTYFEQDLSPGLLREGTNILAVEVHQASAVSTDLSFDLDLIGSRLNPPAIAQQPRSLTVTNGDTAEFTVVSGGSEAVNFQWYFFETNVLARATNATLILSNVTPAQAGSYRVALINPAGRRTSAPAQLIVLQPPTNQPPIATLTSPTGDAEFRASTAIPLRALASDSDGRVVAVEFFAEDLRIGRTETAPFAFDWIGAAVGAHHLRAEAIDDNGDRGTSAVVVIRVIPSPPPPSLNVTLVDSGSVWKYSDTGMDLGEGWTGIDFVDQSWKEGPAELGYGDAPEDRPEATEIGFGPDPNNKYLTYYFRRRVNVSDARAFRSLKIDLLRDDGAVVYLNGFEVFRSNLPLGPIDFSTLASRAVPKEEETSFISVDLSPTLLVEGPNLLAVEVHQASADSLDLSFDLAMSGEQLNAPVIVAQPQSQSVLVGDTVSFSVTAVGRPPLRYQWRVNGLNPLPGATNASLTFSNVVVADEGSYSVEVFNNIGMSLSAAAVLTVRPAPAILSQPQDAVGILGGAVDFQVVATDVPSLAYQWFFDVTNRLIGATNLTLQLVNLRTADAGGYSVVISNLHGSVTSRVARLVVGELPTVMLQPLNQTVLAGSRIEISTVLGGSSPFSFQWLFDGGTEIPGATDSKLTLEGVSPADTGLYRVRVSNSIGAVTSPASNLRVLVPPLITEIRRTNGAAWVSLSSVSGLRYSLEGRSDRPDDLWNQIPGTLKLVGTGLRLVLTNAPATNRVFFYRVLVE